MLTQLPSASRKSTGSLRRLILTASGPRACLPLVRPSPVNAALDLRLNPFAPALSIPRALAPSPGETALIQANPRRHLEALHSRYTLSRSISTACLDRPERNI